MNVTIKGTISGPPNTEMVVNIKLSWNDQRIKNSQPKVRYYFKGDIYYFNPVQWKFYMIE